MKILLVGKTGVFDTLAVASGYLDNFDLANSPYFADLNLENSKNVFKIGDDEAGNEILVVGYNHPKIIHRINQDLISLSAINDQNALLVVPLSENGETMSWVLLKLANLPWLGPLFIKWLKSRTLNRSQYLFDYGQNLPMKMKDTNQSLSQPAAKPIIEH